MHMRAQRARYTDPVAGFTLELAGKNGHTVHAWSSPEHIGYGDSKTTLSLHIFSPDMKLITEKQVALGKIRYWRIDFQDADTGYYANVVYASVASTSRILLKVSQDGNMRDVSDSPRVWKKNFLGTEKGKFYTTTRIDNIFYAVKINNETPGDSILNAKLSNDGADNAGNIKTFQSILIKKVNLRDTSIWQQEFSTSHKYFYYPLLKVADSSIVLCAFAESTGNIEKKPGIDGSALFLQQLDTSLGITKANRLIKLKAGIKDDVYCPINIFSAANRNMVMSQGLRYQPSYNAMIPAGSGNGFRSTRIINTLAVNSLRITVADSSNTMVADTVIETTNKNGMQWENFHVVKSTDKIDFFCTKKFSGSRGGITHLTIDNNGKVQEEDLIVDVRYQYLLPTAKLLEPGVLLVPFHRRGKTGIMKINYTPGEIAE